MLCFELKFIFGNHDDSHNLLYSPTNGREKNVAREFVFLWCGPWPSFERTTTTMCTIKLIRGVHMVFYTPDAYNVVLFRFIENQYSSFFFFFFLSNFLTSFLRGQTWGHYRKVLYIYRRAVLTTRFRVIRLFFFFFFSFTRRLFSLAVRIESNR